MTTSAQCLPRVRRAEVRVQWQSTWDRDDATLRYRLVRDDAGPTPIREVTTVSQSWDRPSMGFTDTGLTPGTTYTYRVRVVDDDGNLVKGLPASITLPAAGQPAPSAYARAVLADSPRHYWQLGTGAGSISPDLAGGSWLTVDYGITRAARGAVSGAGPTASTFSGAASAIAYTPDRVVAPRSFSIEAWVSTRTTAGGRILGLQRQARGIESTRATAIGISTSDWTDAFASESMRRRASRPLRRRGRSTTEPGTMWWGRWTPQ